MTVSVLGEGGREWKAKIDVLQAEFSAAQRKVTAQNGNPNQVDVAELNRAVLQKKDELAVATSAAQKKRHCSLS